MLKIFLAALAFGGAIAFAGMTPAVEATIEVFAVVNNNL